jgi:serine/threonine protein kinase
MNPTEENSIWKIMTDIVGGLCFIHGHHEVHGNLKPRNSDILDISLISSIISK